MRKLRRPWFLKSRRRRSAEKQARVRQDAKDLHKKVRANGHTPRRGGSRA